jgi:hypothetical protein
MTHPQSISKTPALGRPRHRNARWALVLGSAFVALGACRPSGRADRADQADRTPAHATLPTGPTGATGASAQVSRDAASPLGDASADASANATANATANASANASTQTDAGQTGMRRAALVVQRVETQCYVEPGDVRTAFVGHDVFVEVTNEDPQRPKATRTTVVQKVFAFCPPQQTTGKPKLDMFEMCHPFVACTTNPSDAGTQAAVTCGKERITLEHDGGRTLLRGSFGIVEVAADEVPLLPVIRRKRIAHVDC